MRFTLPGSAGSSVVLAVLLAPPWSEAGRLVAFLLSVSVAGGRGSLRAHWPWLSAWTTAAP